MRDVVDATATSASTLTERKQRGNGQLRPIRRIAPEPMTGRSGIEDEAGRTVRTGNVERPRLLNSPTNSGRSVELTPLEHLQSRFSHATSTL